MARSEDQLDRESEPAKNVENMQITEEEEKKESFGVESAPDKEIFELSERNTR